MIRKSVFGVAAMLVAVAMTAGLLSAQEEKARARKTQQQEPPSVEDMQKQLDGLRKQMGQMQAQVEQIRRQMTKMAKSGNTEDFQKFSDDFSKQFGGGGGMNDDNEEKPAEKSARKPVAKKSTPAPVKKPEPQEDDEEEETAKVPAVWIGVTGEATDSGYKVTGFKEGAPAKTAGIQKNDVIKKFNGKDVTTAEEIVAAELPCKPGDKVKVTVIRGGKDVELEMTLEKRPAEPPEDEEEDDDKKEDKEEDEKGEK